MYYTKSRTYNYVSSINVNLQNTQKNIYIQKPIKVKFVKRIYNRVISYCKKHIENYKISLEKNKYIQYNIFNKHVIEKVRKRYDDDDSLSFYNKTLHCNIFVL